MRKMYVIVKSFKDFWVRIGVAHSSITYHEAHYGKELGPQIGAFRWDLPIKEDCIVVKNARKL
jgi:hypothetical protein